MAPGSELSSGECPLRLCLLLLLPHLLLLLLVLFFLSADDDPLASNQGSAGRIRQTLTMINGKNNKAAKQRLQFHGILEPL